MQLLQVINVAKSYGPVVALRSAELNVDAGEVHALMGANGAGKSTLVKILTGVLRPDSGEIRINGSPVQITSPQQARRAGLAPVFQDPALLPDLTIAHNLKLTRSDPARVLSELDQMGVTVDLEALASEVPLPVQRLVDLARALSHDPSLLLLDEITAALPADLAESVARTVRSFRDSGRSVLVITHRLAEVTAMCDRATVLRDGVAVGTRVPRAGEEEGLVELMLGEAAQSAEPARASATAAHADRTSAGDGPPALSVSGLRIVDSAPEGVDFDLRSGEVVGLAALEGQGQDRLFELLAGDRRIAEGEMRVGGHPLRPRHPYDAIRAGVVLVPADRMLALLPQRPIRENVAAPLYNRIARWGPINLRRERDSVDEAIARLQIDTRAASQARRLSGGNRQKLTIARWVAAGCKVMLCFDPTRGIDVGTKRQIYELLRELADAGTAILLFTSELPEIQNVCDRAIVLAGGRVTGRLSAAEATEPRILRAAHGLVPDAPVVAATPSPGIDEKEARP